MAKSDFKWITTKKLQNGILSTLKKIRKTIDTPEKWTKGEFEDRNEAGESNYCLVGAAREVDGTFELGATAAIALSLSAGWALDKKGRKTLVEDFTQVGRKVNNYHEPYLNPIYNFNDAEKTTHKQILALLDRASKNVAAAR